MKYEKVIIYEWESVVPFGKFKGYNVSEIADEAPQYLLWAEREIPSFKLSDDALIRVKRARAAQEPDKPVKFSLDDRRQYFSKKAVNLSQKEDYGEEHQS